MLRIIFSTMVYLASLNQLSFAEESPEVVAAENDEPQNKEKWETKLKTEYKLTDEQIVNMQSKGITYPQMGFVSQLATKSGKSQEEILKMRTEQHMGWGKIAKELGVPPKEMMGSMHSKKMEHKQEMHSMMKQNRKEMHQLKKEQRKERKELRKENKKEKKNK